MQSPDDVVRYLRRRAGALRGRLSGTNRVGAVSRLVASIRPVRCVHGRNTGDAARGTLDELIEAHFRDNSTPDHPNRDSMKRALALLDGRPANILETGSSAWGANSSLLFDQYVRRFGGRFVTIDIRPQPARALGKRVGPATGMIVGDSLRALEWLAARGSAPFDFVYLDAFDLDVSNPIPSMVHCLNEFLLLPPLVAPGALVLIDDTPKSNADWQRVTGPQSSDIVVDTAFGRLVAGKGALVERFLDTTRFEVVEHGYQLLLRKIARE